MQTIPAHLDELIETLRADFGVPGAAVSVVKDDAVIYAKGFGVLEQGKPDPVDADSIFGIGSNTKAFTATAVGLLVQEGRLGWDDPVTQYLPGFQLYDPVATREITVRDLLCHRVGLPTFGGDFMGYGSTYTDEEALARVRFIPPAFRLRTGYGYANLMYLAAGLVIKAVSGIAWADFIRQRLLEPMGMERTLISGPELSQVENVAQPHQMYRGELVTVPYSVFHNGAPAGALVSSARDMATWLRFQINKGRVGDVQLVNESIIEETRTPQVLIPLSPEDRQIVPRRHFQAYGLGWNLGDYAGRLVASHGGGVDGMQSLTVFVPEERLGYAVLTNRIPHYLNAALHRMIIDSALGFSDRNWRQLFLEMRDKDLARAAEQRKKLEESRPAGTRPSLPLSEYCGNYENPIYGPVTVAEENGGLAIHLGAHPNAVGPLEHWHTDTFFCRWSYSSLEESFVPFTIGIDGRVESLKIKVAEFVDPLVYEFKKV